MAADVTVTKEALLGLAMALSLPAILSRCAFLAPTRFGVLFYHANVWKEFIVRRLNGPGWIGDIGPLGASLAISATQGVGGLFLGEILVFLVMSLELWIRVRQRQALTDSGAVADSRWVMPGRGPDTAPLGSVPNPAYHPQLTVTVEGPFVERVPRLDLGDLAVDRRIRITGIVANHSTVPGLMPVEVKVSVSGPIRIQGGATQVCEPLRSGMFMRFPVDLVATGADGRGEGVLTVTSGPFTASTLFRFRGARPDLAVKEARVSRYPGAKRAAFAWRGDMDHYDTVTFQSVEGLMRTLGLAARYRFPQTMFLSTRLTLDVEETTRYYQHFGVERGQEEVPRFVDWVNKTVDLRLSAPYPFESDRPYVLEIGNHMHLHYGTDAAAAEENGWKRAARICEGRYRWTNEGADSFTEQRDNALEASRRIESAFGFRPRSWATPDSTFDEETPRAVEAAGCEVMSDAIGGHTANVLSQPAPYHPPGTRAVELSKRFPGDPETLVEVEMIRYWMHRGHRLGIPVVFMCHQHMRQFAGDACARMTEWVLRRALTDFAGDLYVDTVWGIGSWWKNVLSPVTGCISVRVNAGTVVVSNASDEALRNVPVDLALEGGGRATALVDLEPRSSLKIGVAGTGPAS